MKSQLASVSAYTQTSVSSGIETIKSDPSTATCVASAVAATAVLVAGFANAHHHPNTSFGPKEAGIVAASLAAVGAGHYVVATKKKSKK